MARSRELKVVIAGDADKLNKEIKGANQSLDKLGKQTRLTASLSSKGYAAMKIGATGAAAAAAGLVVASKKVVEAAIESEKSNSRLKAQLKALDISYSDHADQIDRVIQKTSQLAGLDDEDLQDAFTAIVRTTGDVNAGLKDMALVADLARAKNMDVAKAGEFLAKIHAGNVGGLRRLGLEFTKTTENVDKLKKSSQDASAQDLRFAQAQDAKANSEKALNLLRQTFQGQAERYGKTTAGAVDRANVAFENLEETIGAALAPTVEDIATKVADFVNEMQDGTGQGGRFVKTLKNMWEETKPIVLWIGRATKNVAQFASEHPALLKLAGGVLAVGAAVKTLRFVSAATGFTHLLSAGRVAAKGLRSILSRGGVAAGEAAAESVAASFAGNAGKIRSSASKVGRSSGRAFGVALRAGAIVGLADIGVQVSRTIKDQLGKAGLWNPPGGRGSFWDNLIPDNLLPQIKPGQGLVGKLLPKKKAAGGFVPGEGRGDHVPALLEPGEFVIRKAVVDKFGPTYFANINGSMGQSQDRRYSSGGIVARANKLDSMAIPYLWGGGHGGRGINKAGMDCSGAVSYALGVSPRVSGQFMSFGKPGPGSPNDTKIYANPSHVFAVFNGRGWGTSKENPGGGPGWLSYNHRSGFTIRHLEDSGGAGGATVGDTQESVEAGKARRTAAQERSGSRLVNKILSSGLRGASGLAKAAGSLGASISAGDTAYGLKERFFGQVLGGKAGAYGDEDLGTATGRKQRITELAALKALKADQLADMVKRAAKLRQLIARYTKTLRTLSKARDKAKGAKRAKMSERIKPVHDRLIDYQAELTALGESIQSVRLDIGDLDKDIGEVAATPDTVAEAGPTAGERASDLTSLIDLRERAGVIDAGTAQAQKIAVLEATLAGKLGPLSEREQLQIMGDLRDVQAQGVAALEAATSAIKEMTDAINENTRFAQSVVATENAVLVKGMADLISGQIAGFGIAGRGLMPGTAGVRARY